MALFGLLLALPAPFAFLSASSGISGGGKSFLLSA